MKPQRIVSLFVFLFAALIVPAALSAGGDKKEEQKKEEQKKDERAKDVIVNSELINADLKDKVLTQSYCKTYTYKMIEGRRYQIDLMSSAFDAFLRLENPQGTQVGADDDGGVGLNSRIIYRAPKTGDYTICAMSLGGGSTGKFTLMVKDVTDPNQVAAGKPIELKNVRGGASAKATLGQNDPMYNGKRHKLFLFNMEAGKTYQIDMMAAFDTYLFLEDPDSKLLAQDDDGGDGLNSRITIRANKTGKHRIIATYFNNGNGAFNLTIRQTGGALPKDEDKKKD